MDVDETNEVSCSGENSGKNSFPFLTFAGLKPGNEKFSELSVELIMESSLGQETLTNGFIMELWSLVELQARGQKEEISPVKITRRQFSEIVGCILFKWTPGQITQNFIKKVSYPRDVDVLRRKLDTGVLGQFDVWQRGKDIFEKYTFGNSDVTRKPESDDNSTTEVAIELQPNPDIEGGAQATIRDSLLSHSTNIPDSEPGRRGSPKPTSDFLLLNESAELEISDFQDLTEDQEKESETGESEASLSVFSSCPNLIKLGFLKDGSSVLECLRIWNPAVEDLTNGVILEIERHFGDAQTLKMLISKIYLILKIHFKRQNQNLYKCFSSYIKRTKLKIIELDKPWIYFGDLSPGGKLFKPELLKPPSKFDETIQNLLNVYKNQEQFKVCSGCGSEGDYFCCQGCFSMFYCSRGCQIDDWLSSHKLSCQQLSEGLLKTGVMMPPSNLPENTQSLKGKFRRSLGLLKAASEKIENLEIELEDLNAGNKFLADINDTNAEMVLELRLEISSLKSALLRSKKEKAGKSSAFKKLKRKFDEIEDESDDENMVIEGSKLENKKTQTVMSVTGQEVELIEVKRDLSHTFNNLEVFSAKELKIDPSGKSYGESSCVRLPSSRTTWPNHKVSTRAVQGRASTVKDFITLISGASHLSREESMKAENILFSFLIKQNQDVFRNLLRTNTDILSIVMKMSPEESSKFMHLSSTSYSSKRKMSTMFGKIFHFNILSSEKKQRSFEKSKLSLVDRSKLEHGTLLMHKTATSEHSTLCSFVRVSDLSVFISELITLAKSQETPDPASMKNLQHPLYFGKIWIIIAGDKGAQTMKFVAGVGGHDPHLFGMFEASDTPANLLAFQSKYIQQLRQMIAFGLEVTKDDDGDETEVLEVEVLATGDKAYLYDENGHAGAAASYPSIFRLVTSTHLRKSHLDGSPHNMSNPECQFPDRTPDGIDRDYHENVNDKRAGNVRTRGKFHNSIVGPRLLPLRSQYHFCVSSLHIGLGLVLRMMEYIEIDCDMIDGTKNVDDLAELENRFDELEGVAITNSDDEEESPQLMDEDVVLSEVMQINKVKRDMLEVEWMEKSMEVLEMEEKEKEVSEEIFEKLTILDRIEFVLAGDTNGVKAIAKKANRVRHCLKSFGNWKPRESWHCDHCLLTGFDRDIVWRVCNVCNKNTHVFCQVWSDSDMAAISAENSGLYQCRKCSGVTTLPGIRSCLLDQIQSLKIRSTDLTVELSRFREEESHLKHNCSQFMGSTRLKLQEVLEKDLSVNRADYHTSCFVGNHCDIIVDKFEKVTEVLSSKPEVREKYEEFFKYYKPVHFLMKAHRFLTSDELDLIDFNCEKLGEVYPKHFKGKTIPPKLDDLIFVVPRFARRWNTVGGLREEKIEAFHNSSKYYNIFIGPGGLRVPTAVWSRPPGPTLVPGITNCI